MTDQFSQGVLLKVVAQICQMVGFHRIMTSPLNILVDIIREFICHLGQGAQHYAEHCGRSCFNLNDLSLAFSDFRINPSELSDFLMNVSPLPRSIVVPKYPVTKHSVESHCDESQSLQVNSNEEPRGALKIKISLSKIKAAAQSKRNKSMKNKKKKKKKSNRPKK